MLEETGFICTVTGLLLDSIKQSSSLALKCDCINKNVLTWLWVHLGWLRTVLEGKAVRILVTKGSTCPGSCDSSKSWSGMQSLSPSPPPDPRFYMLTVIGAHQGSLLMAENVGLLSPK